MLRGTFNHINSPASGPGYGIRRPAVGMQVNWDHYLAAGLVGCWIFNERAGQRLQNLANPNYPATIPVAGTPWVADTGGPSLQFNGTTQYCTTGTQQLGNTRLFANATDQFSVFVRWTWLSGIGSLVSRSGNGAASTRQFNYRVGGSTFINLIVRGSNIVTTDPTVGTAGIWRTSCYVYSCGGVSNGGTGVYYANGVVNLSGITIGNSAEEATNITFGANADGTADFLNARFSHVLIYDRPLTATEVFWLNANPVDMLIPTSTQLKYFLPPPAAASSASGIISMLPLLGVGH